MPNTGIWGNFYDDCVGYELFHPQHVVRLANKNGRAYFVVAQSRAHNGWISVLETEPGVLNPSTDLLKPRGNGLVDGHYIWSDLYSGVKNGVINPIGNWNHPGKMEVIGDILVVAAQNWGESAPCFYGKGTSEDQVLFYDVRDPRKPFYIGNMTASQLKVKEISTVGILRAPNGDYLLTAGGGGTFTTRMARKVSPDIKDWELVSSGFFGGQHGMMFNSYQKTSKLGSLPAGTERIMYFDSEDRNKLAFNEYSYDPLKRGLVAQGAAKFPYQLPGANRDWDSDSLYVSPNGSTTIYSMESATGSNGILYQLSNLPALNAVTPTKAPTTTPVKPQTTTPTATAKTNVALASNGGVATASSTIYENFPTMHPLASAINGDRTGRKWGNGGGWNDATSGEFPDWLQIDFSGSKSIDEINVVTLQDGFGQAGEPTAETKFATYGIKDFVVQYWNGTDWVTVQGGSVTSNDRVIRTFKFTPVSTTKIRVTVTAALQDYSRIVQLEAWGNPPTSTPRGSTVFTGCGFTYKTKSARDTQCGGGDAGTSIWIGDGVDESKMTRGQIVYTGCGYTYASKASRDAQCGGGEAGTTMWIPE